MTEFLQVNNGQIAFDDAGSGPIVICVPSLGDVRAEYRFLKPYLLAAGYRVITMDVRGHGESSTGWEDYSVAGIGQDILAMIQNLDGGPAYLVGTSMAGGAAIWAAAEQPELISGLILIDAFVDGDSDPFLVAVLSLAMARPWGPKMWTKYYSSLYPTFKPEDFEGYRAALEANVRQRGRLEAVMAMLRASKRASGERLSQIKQPALVLMGSRDPDFKNPKAEAERIGQAINAEVNLIENAGHYPHAEMPEKTAALILDFLKSTAKG